MHQYSSVTLNASPGTPISEGSKKITFTKIPIVPQKKIPDRFGPKLLKLLKVFHEKSAQTNRSKEIWVLISKGLNHLNTVLK